MRRTVFTTIAVMFFGCMALFATHKSKSIADWWRLRDYVPDPAIVQLTEDAGFNDHGDTLFYVHDPALLQKDVFAERCTVGEATIVLGCYIAGQRIYLFDVDDARLNGIEEVTAAHEMLHAAYDRLSRKEQERMNALLLKVFSDLDDARIASTIQTYTERDPTVVPNELHSILGTEVVDLPDELEQHYSRYFDDRQKVVKLAKAYASEFALREQQIADFDKNLESLQSQISAGQESLDLQGGELDQERLRLEQLRDSPDQYNTLVNGYNALVREYNFAISQLKELIESYNTTVTERNAIALEERQLVEAIDTRVDEL